MDAQSTSQNQSGTVKAQMPGLITKLLVEEGQKVAMNQTLFILEAMKMENAIQSETSGTVGQILVKEGQSVSKGDLILEISE